MEQAFILLVFSLLTASCATILNKPWMETTVYTTEPSLIVINNTSFKTIDNKTQVLVERKKEPLEFVVI